MRGSEGCGGGRIILMASRALAACAKSPDDYVKVYGRILSQAREPVIIHWLGEMFDSALAGYWGSRERDRQVETLLAIVSEYAAKIDGVKISLLDQAREIAMRSRFPKAVRMYTGDDFDYPTTIRGDGRRHSDALSASSTSSPGGLGGLKALDRATRPPTRRSRPDADAVTPRLRRSHALLQEPASCSPPTATGHQSHFRMVGGLESARSIVHLTSFRLMDAAGHPAARSRAGGRPHASGPGRRRDRVRGAVVALAPGNHYRADLRAIRFTLWDHLGTDRLFKDRWSAPTASVA